MNSLHINHKAIRNLFAKDHKNKVTVLDLFFDITLIVFIGGISHELISNLSDTSINGSNVFTGILELFTIFFIGRIYMIFAMYTFQSISYRILTMVVMASLVAMGIASYFAAATEDSFLLNIIGFDVAMLAMAFSYFVASSKMIDEAKMKNNNGNPSKRAIALISSFILAIIIATVALGLNYTSGEPSTKRVIILSLWALNLIQLFAIEFFSARGAWKYGEDTVDLIEERYNVLFVLFCGEGIITVVTTFATSHHGSSLFDNSFGYLIMSFIAIFGTGGLFNDYITYTKLKRENKYVNAFTYIMLPFLASISTFFIGVALMIEGHHNLVGSVTIALAFATIAILFPLLLLLQEPFRDDHMYIRRRAFDRFLVGFGTIFGAAIITIDVLFPIPFLVIGIALGGITLGVIFAFVEYLHSLKSCRGDRKTYEILKKDRVKDQLFK